MENQQNTSAERTVLMYALLAWSNEYTAEQAKEIASTMDIDELRELTKAKDSIEAALDGIFKGFKTFPKKDQSTDHDWDTVIEIIAKIHDKWVETHPEEYNRGTIEKSNKKLFQHLDTALIGIDEISLDLMFLAPFIDELFGMHAGEMELVGYGSFKPSEEVIKAYNRYVEKYKENNHIETVEDLAKHIENIIEGRYHSLAVKNESGLARREYMLRHIGLLVQTVISKNLECFGDLQMSEFVCC